MENETKAYNSGGFSTNNGDKLGDSVSEWFGRIKNNLSGTTAQNMYNSREAELTRAYNSAEAQKNRDWQTEMSNTAYQRAVADMKAAGINPASLGGDASGSPASTPSGSAASASSASSSNASGGFGNLFMDIAASAIGKAIFSKFSHSTASAGAAAAAAKNASKAFNNSTRKR